MLMFLKALSGEFPQKYGFSIEPSTFHCHLPSPPHCPQELQVKPAPQRSCLPASSPPPAPSPPAWLCPRAGHAAACAGPARGCGPARASGPGPGLRGPAWGFRARPGAAGPSPGQPPPACPSPGLANASRHLVLWSRLPFLL